MEPSGDRALLGPGAGRRLFHCGGQAVLRRTGAELYEPRLAGRALLCTFPGLMTTWVDAFQKTPLFGAVDAVSSPTPMALLHAGALPDLTLSQLMLGQHGGAMGGAPVFMLLLGGVYLVGRRVISPRIPLSYLGTVALLTLLFPRGNGGRWPG